MITYENGIMKVNFGQEQIELYITKLDFSFVNYDPIEEAKSMTNNLSKYIYENIDFRTDSSLNIPDEYHDFI
ncbi:unnamed protein product [Rotaria sordida]|uniref:Uncharacterized protein n=1 Tax=Rotaria sordida TaxID=392033 RepID=A0A819ELB9_9BILA|nr:unnamed protein product [Rotaria sordida]CAF3852945.1 unnamed protein product [Rotaria sordida]